MSVANGCVRKIRDCGRLVENSGRNSLLGIRSADSQCAYKMKKDLKENREKNKIEEIA